MDPGEPTSTPTSTQLVTEVVTLLMRLRGDRQTALADALGLVRTAVTHRLNGVTPWSLADLDGLALFYGVSPATFLVPAQLLLGGGGVGGDQGLAGVVQPLDVATLVQQQPGPQAVAARRRRPRRRPEPPAGDQLPLQQLAAS